MKFKIGDKVILKRSSDFTFVSSMEDFVDTESTITMVKNKGGGRYLYNVKSNIWNWDESALELANESLKSQEYFYVGQTVYSPFFNNKENKAVVTRIDKTMDYPVLCEGDNAFGFFTLEGKFHTNQEFISLFQESIQFPVNKPIETFEKGEIVEVSDDGSQWIPVYYKGVSSDKRKPHEIYFAKKNGEFTSTETYVKIRKIK